MQITRQQLIDWSACTGGLEWFDANYPSGEGEYVDVQLALRRDGHRYYSKWLLSIVINNIPDASVAECAFGDALIEKMADEVDHVTNDASRLSASGKNSVIAASGIGAEIMVGPGGCAAIAYHDGSRVRFAIAYEGENVRAGIRYSVNGKGEFVEVQQ